MASIAFQSSQLSAKALKIRNFGVWRMGYSRKLKACYGGLAKEIPGPNYQHAELKPDKIRFGCLVSNLKTPYVFDKQCWVTWLKFKCLSF